MPHWFLNTRAHSHGGPVAPVKVLDSDRPGWPYDLTQELLSAIQGREVFFATHGYEVNQDGGIASLNGWLDNLQIGSAVPIGILWPGDCVIPIFVDYVLEGRDAISSGKELAVYLNKNFTGSASVSFASHSLGARVVLQTISGLSNNVRVRRVVLMAGAIDDNCLTGEYSSATNNIEEISVLASTCDDVLALAYPLGNPIQGIFDSGHPYYHAALGRTGPAQPYPSAPPLHVNWQIPTNLNFGHHDYLPSPPPPIVGTFPPTVDIPPDNGPVPPAATPPPAAIPQPWKPAWTAAFASTRYK
jgi:Alpha/beta hydrolase of unknown function (DUF900)